jgi:uncharacterized membrane protein YfbV (UPF0208 family)
MEALQAVLAKVQNHQVIITLFWLVLLTVFAALILLRQRRVNRLENLIGAHFANIRNKLEETEAARKNAGRRHRRVEKAERHRAGVSGTVD